MKASTKAIIIGVAALGILSAGAITVNAAASGETYPSIVQRIAKAFNLDPAKVNDVFNQERQDRMAKQQTQFEDRLNQAVKDGTITKAQKDAIVAKADELKKKREEIMKLDPQDRRAAMQKMMQDLQTWAEKNKIDLKQVMGIGGMMRGFGGMGGGMHGRGGAGGMGRGWGHGGGMMNPPSGTDGGSAGQPQSTFSIPQGQQL